jgi:hypothetical protein
VVEEVRRENVDDDDVVVVVNAHVHVGTNKSNTESSFIMMFNSILFQQPPPPRVGTSTATRESLK